MYCDGGDAVSSLPSSASLRLLSSPADSSTLQSSPRSCVSGGGNHF